MKKLSLILVISFFSFNIYANDNLIYVRDLFYRSSKSSISADSLFIFLNKTNSNVSAAFIGYKGMSKLMLCYHSYNPYTKFKYFLDGKNLLEQAIKNDPNNIELRFLRLTVQLNTPSFLGYKNNINEDKAVIYNGVQNIKDLDLLSRIYNYTTTAKNLTQQEKQFMQNAVLANKLAINIWR